MGNRQQLTPRLTTTFAYITQPVAIQNTFAMSFLENFSQWSKLDTKNQTGNQNKMNFPTFNCKIRKKVMQTFIYFINKRLTVTLGTKYRLI